MQTGGPLLHKARGTPMQSGGAAREDSRPPPPKIKGTTYSLGDAKEASCPPHADRGVEGAHALPRTRGPQCRLRGPPQDKGDCLCSLGDIRGVIMPPRVRGTPPPSSKGGAEPPEEEAFHARCGAQGGAMTLRIGAGSTCLILEGLQEGGSVPPSIRGLPHRLGGPCSPKTGGIPMQLGGRECKGRNPRPPRIRGSPMEPGGCHRPPQCKQRSPLTPPQNTGSGGKDPFSPAASRPVSL